MGNILRLRVRASHFLLEVMPSHMAGRDLHFQFPISRMTDLRNTAPRGPGPMKNPFEPPKFQFRSYAFLYKGVLYTKL